MFPETIFRTAQNFNDRLAVVSITYVCTYDEFDLDRLTDGLERIEREDRRLIDKVMREAGSRV